MDKEKFENQLIGNNHDHTVAIYKRCPNAGKPCFCTGECQEIIGYRENTH